MSFHGPIDQPTQAAGRRKAARLRLALPARIILISGHHRCQLIDLSQSGACIALDQPALPPGADVVLMAEGVETFGTVVWRRGSQFGVKFDEALPRDDVVRLRGRHDHFQEIEMQQQRRRAHEFVAGRKVF
jgi:hypothetical protein